jgi:hypothetical protein
MMRFTIVLFVFVFGMGVCFVPFAEAYQQHSWEIRSPDHEQTFAYGMEQNRVWKQWGRNNHLALLLSYTNDPFVDRTNPRQYDNFRFDFPQVTLGRDGHFFFYRTPDGRSVPVAKKSPDFLGVDEVSLLPNADVVVDKPHGYITVTIEVQDVR